MIISPLQEIKFDQIFHIYANADGIITSASYDAYIERIRQEFAWSYSDQTYLMLRQQLLGQWQVLLRYADTKQDGVIDRQEHHAFLAAMILGAIARGDYGEIDQVAHQWFALLDQNGDGKVGAMEYQMFLNSDGYYHVDAAEVVAYLDQDGDGLLTEGEIVEAHREFWVANDPFAKGNYLFGQDVRALLVLE